ncbi:hypothetical protein [Nitratifractor sp.]
MASDRFVLAVLENTEKDKLTPLVQALIDSGVSKENVSVLSRIEEEEKIEDAEIKAAERKILNWSEWGALSGGLLGLLIGAVVFTAPIAGTVAAAGASLTGAINGLIGGAVVGGALFGVADGLIEWGVGAEDAKRLEKLLEEGKILLMVKTDEEKAAQIEETLRSNGAQSTEIL